MNQTTQLSEPEPIELSEEQMRKMAGVSGTISLGVGWAFLYTPSRVTIYGVITKIYTWLMELINRPMSPARRDTIYELMYPAYDFGAALVGAALIAFALLMFAVIVVSRYAPDKSVVR